LKQQCFKYNIAGKDAQSSLFLKKKQSFFRNYADEEFFLLKQQDFKKWQLYLKMTRSRIKTCCRLLTFGRISANYFSFGIAEKKLSNSE